jgi:hypothetical protein
VAPYFDETLVTRETAPPDFGPSKRYRRDVSVMVPVTSTAPAVAREPLDPLLRSLGLLAPAFRALAVGSAGEDWHTMSPAQQRALIADVGVPAFRASLELGEGVTLSFPAMAGRPPVDPREAPYFRNAEGKRGIVWGSPTVVDNESILAATAPVYDDRGVFRGVARLEVSLARLLARPKATELEYVQSRLLVGRNGKLMAEDNTAEGRAPLAPEVVAAIAAGKSGSLAADVNGRHYQYSYYPLASLDWYYVAASEVGHMLASKEPMVTSDPSNVVHPSSPAPSPKLVVGSAPARATSSALPVEVDAGAPADAGSNGGDPHTPGPAGDARDAGVPLQGRLGLGPLPKPSLVPRREPPNPFEKWKVYERKKTP